MHAPGYQPDDYYEPAYSIEYPGFRLENRSRHASSAEAVGSSDINVAFRPRNKSFNS